LISYTFADDIALEEDVERKAGWLLKLFFLGTFGFVGYQSFRTWVCNSEKMLHYYMKPQDP